MYVHPQYCFLVRLRELKIFELDNYLIVSVKLGFTPVIS